ncbi:protein RER1 [Camelus ferus]|nr:protein RER1 [Camelus ferus]
MRPALSGRWPLAAVWAAGVRARPFFVPVEGAPGAARAVALRNASFPLRSRQEVLVAGWYIVTYALGIYHLNLFIAFLSPKVDPSLMEDSDDGPSLPTKQSEEFRPFIRRLPEFKFWRDRLHSQSGLRAAPPTVGPLGAPWRVRMQHAATKGILVAMVCTFFEAFNVPVFWPILVMYFIMLFCITMKRQIKHMIKYRYIPFTHGKRTYKGKEDVGKAFAS